MTRFAGIFLFAALAAPPVLAQSAGGTAAAPDLATGRQLYEQSCGVCHTKPLINSGRFGPALSRESLGGQADVMAQVISEGVPRMPGFKHHFSQGQIRSIVAYVQTLAPPPPDAPPTARTSGERRDDN